MPWPHTTGWAAPLEVVLSRMSPVLRTIYVWLVLGLSTGLWAAINVSPGGQGPTLDLAQILRQILQQQISSQQSPIQPQKPPSAQFKPPRDPQLPPQQSLFPADPSPFGPQLPYQPRPQNGPANMGLPPLPYMFGPGRAECSGAYVPGQLCCDGIVNPMPPGGMTQWGCCHKGIYDMTTQVCCGDVPVPKPRGGPPQLCCGTMLYNPATHFCCGSFPVANPTGLMKCCRSVAYNPTTDLCCGESVRPRSPLSMSMECCGKHMYNPVSHTCCDEGNTIPREPSVQCCGKGQFQPAIQQCCFGDALPRDAGCMA